MKPTRVKHFESPGEFRKWLEAHHAKRDELWVGFWKKWTGRPSLTWQESVDEALCFGWIDGIRKRINEESYTIRFTPRRIDSIWSHRNVNRYLQLETEGRIEPPGAHAFNQRTAEKTGMYSFEQEEGVSLSKEYLQRLKSDAQAWADWNERPPGYRKQVAHWVMSAKRESTRERRLTALIEDCAAGRKVKPLRL